MKNEVSPAIIAVVVVVVLGLLGAVGFMVFGKHASAPGLNSSNPNYEKYMNHTGSGGGPGHATGGSPGGGSPGPGSPTSAGH